jgi:hypothetical protein
LKILVKHVLALAILIPLYVFSLPDLLWPGDIEAKLFELFPVLLVSLVFVDQLRKPIAGFRVLGNFLGGCLPMVSLFLPYSFSGGYPQSPFDSWAVSQGIPHLIVVGSLLTFFTRFRSVLTFAGLLEAYSNHPRYFCSALGCPLYVTGPGFWVAWAGVFVSLLGYSLIVYPKNAEGRKLLGSILLPVGLIVAISGGVFTSVWFNSSGPAIILTLILIVSGLLISGAGLTLFLGFKSTIMTKIRRVLQKPLW